MSSGRHPPQADLFTGPLSGFEGLLVHSHKSESLPAAALADPDVLREQLTHYHAHSGGDWCAACSHWSQLYFRTLIVPAVAMAILRREPIGLALADLHVILGADRCEPLAFVQRPQSPPPDAAGCLAALLEGHLTPLITVLSCVGQLSRKLLWENAAWPLAFVLQVVVDRRPMLAPAVAAVIDRPLTDPAARGALASVRKTALRGLAFERRLCCMRDRIPGMCPCAGQCPRVRRLNPP